MDEKPNDPYLRDRLRKIWPGLPSSAAELRRTIGDAVTDVGRLTLATVLGYLLTVRLLPPPVDLTGALTALLIVQASLRGSFRAGLVRVMAVVTGIVTALTVATFVGLQWWSLALVVFAALLMARVLRLEGGSMEAAISAMLILGSAGVDVAAFTRFATTVIGTAVGIALPLLWPRRVRTPDLTRELRQVTDRLVEVYQEAARHVARHPMTSEAASRWLTATRHITPLIASAAGRLDEAADVQRLNTRQVFRADVVPLLRAGLESLERSLLSSRSLFRIIESAAPQQPTPDDGYGDYVRPALAQVLARLGSGVETFTALLEAEVAGDSSQAEQRHSQAIADARAAAAELTELMRVDPNQTSLWLLRGTILAAIEQILVELDLDHYRAARDEWRMSQLGRALPAGSIGPRIRSPWGLLAHRRLRARAAASRLSHPEGSHQVASDETTALMPAVSDEPPPPEALPD